MDSDLRIPKLRSFLTLLHDIFISIQGLLSIETGWIPIIFCHFINNAYGSGCVRKVITPKEPMGHSLQNVPSCAPVFNCIMILIAVYCSYVFFLCVSVSTSFSPPKILSSMKAEIAFLSHAHLLVPTILSSIQQSYGNNYSYLCVLNKWEWYDNKCWDGGHTRTCFGHVIIEVLQSLISLWLSIFPKAPP